MERSRVIVTNNHACESIETPIILRGGKPLRQVVKGNDVCMGIRVVILPGLRIDDEATFGDGAIVARGVPKVRYRCRYPLSNIATIAAKLNLECGRI